MSGTQNSQSNLEKEKHIWKNHPYDFKTCYKAIVIKGVLEQESILVEDLFLVKISVNRIVYLKININIYG